METGLTQRVVMIGGGHAAGQCAATLRRMGFEGPIAIIGDEPHAPYQRPPLSKAYLSGDMTRERLLLKPESFYQEQSIELFTGRRALSIDRAAKSVLDDQGEAHRYDDLVIATGARVRTLDGVGDDLDGVGYLRCIGDVDRLKERFLARSRLLIVGGGYIGLETAAVATKLGLQVTLLEQAPRLLGRVAGERIASFFRSLHEERGVAIHCDARLARFEGARAVERAVLEGGEAIACDLALIGVGVIANDEIAAAAGLHVQDGVLVDASARTSDPNIYAIGDCTRFESRFAPGSIRLESVPNALEQAKAAAASICGQAAPPAQAPWFWSDQYEVKLQTVGILTGYEKEVARERGPNALAVYYFRDGRLLAVDAVNAPADFMFGKKRVGDLVSESELAA